MILEVAILTICNGMERKFEQAFLEASAILDSIPGYISHQMQRCVEIPGRYMLFINWETLEAHTIVFRNAPEHLRWKQLLGPFYESPAIVEHYALVTQSAA